VSFRPGDAPAPFAFVFAAARAELRRAKQLDLYKFFDEWSEIARTEITRRDHLINLGLGKRKPRRPAAPAAPPAKPA